MATFGGSESALRQRGALDSNFRAASRRHVSSSRDRGRHEPRDPDIGARLAAGDATLVARLRSGEDAAYVELVREHGPSMYAAARRCLRDDTSAQDALQDALVSVFRGIGRFTGASRLSTWLHRVAVNAALMQRRSRVRRPVSLLDAPTLEAVAIDARSTPRALSPAEVVERRESEARLHLAIERLPLGCRGAVLLRDAKHCSLDETAALLGIGLSAAKTRLRRGRDALRVHPGGP